MQLVQPTPILGMHDKRLSVAKAICIMLMVVGHAACPEGLYRWLVNFHMPAFFLISGMLLKENYFNRPQAFVRRRLKGLWWPFVLWSLVFLALTPLMASIGITEDVALSEMPRRVLEILVMRHEPPLLIGYWFLPTLLIASLCGFAALKLARGRLQIVAVETVGFLVLAAVLSLSLHRYYGYNIGRPWLATAYFLTGYMVRNAGTSHLIPAVIALIASVLVARVYSSSMSCEGWEVFIYYPVSLVSIYALLGLSGYVGGVALKVLDYIGSHTLHILTFHVLMFKLITVMRAFLGLVAWDKVSDWVLPHGETTHGLWLLYVVGAVLLSLLLSHFICFIKTRIAKIWPKSVKI